MTTTLITGATGFVGSACMRVFGSSQGDLHACARTRPRDLPSSVTFHTVDLLDSAQTVALLESVRPTRLLHLAWIATPGSYWNSPENEEWAMQSQRLLDAFADQGGTRVVVTGSCAEYDWTSPTPYREVESPTGPTSAYGRAKDGLRRWTESYAIARGVSVTWARLFFLYGPHEHPSRLIPSVASALLQGRPVEIATGNDVRDYLHVEDTAAALVALLGSDLPGVVNVASGEGVTISGIAERIASIVGRPDLVLHSASASKPVSTVTASTSRLRDELGWKPAIGLDDGLQDTVAWWRERLDA